MGTKDFSNLFVSSGDENDDNPDRIRKITRMGYWGWGEHEFGFKSKILTCQQDIQSIQETAEKPKLEANGRDL